jgi:hypothetical protein
LGIEKRVGMMERWNTGILGLCVVSHYTEVMRFESYSNIPTFHYSM